MSLLKTTNLGISFGGLRAVDDVNIEIKEGELIGLIGPNGAGKTTIFNLLTGVYKPTDGDISINGTSVNKKTTPQIVALGVARTFQNIRLFKNLSVFALISSLGSFLVLRPKATLFRTVIFGKIA